MEFIAKDPKLQCWAGHARHRLFELRIAKVLSRCQDNAMGCKQKLSTKSQKIVIPCEPHCNFMVIIVSAHLYSLHLATFSSAKIIHRRKYLFPDGQQFYTQPWRDQLYSIGAPGQHGQLAGDLLAGDEGDWGVHRGHPAGGRRGGKEHAPHVGCTSKALARQCDRYGGVEVAPAGKAQGRDAHEFVPGCGKKKDCVLHIRRTEIPALGKRMTKVTKGKQTPSYPSDAKALQYSSTAVRGVQIDGIAYTCLHMHRVVLPRRTLRNLHEHSSESTPNKK